MKSLFYSITLDISSNRPDIQPRRREETQLLKKGLSELLSMHYFSSDYIPISTYAVLQLWRAECYAELIPLCVVSVLYNKIISIFDDLNQLTQAVFDCWISAAIECPCCDIILSNETPNRKHRKNLHVMLLSRGNHVLSTAINQCRIPRNSPDLHSDGLMYLTYSLFPLAFLPLLPSYIPFVKRVCLELKSIDIASANLDPRYVDVHHLDTPVDNISLSIAIKARISARIRAIMTEIRGNNGTQIFQIMLNGLTSIDDYFTLLDNQVKTKFELQKAGIRMV